MAVQQAEAIVIANPVPEVEVAKGTMTGEGVVGDGKFDSISSMADLKEKAPDVYDALMKGVGMTICRDMQDHQRRLHKLMKKNRDNQ